MRLSGLDQLKEACRALEALGGEITSVRSNPADPASVEAAAAQVEGAIDAKIAPYRGNPTVEKIAAQMKEKYRAQLLLRAAEARSGGENKLTEVDPSVIRALAHIQNTLNDLRAADYQTHERHIKKLVQALHVPELDAITRQLTEGIDLDGWLTNANNAAIGQMWGGAVLSWPTDHENELGTVALLLNHFAEKSGSALPFAMKFYHRGSRNPTDDVQKMVQEILVPFVRDYASYVRTRTAPSATDVKSREVFTLKPTLWGMSIDLKEAWRRIWRRRA